MNTVSVDGVVYTKAGVLGKKYGYTSDYIGQLCRAGKVECQLVGRTWYVTDDSLLVHKNARYGKTRSTEIPLSNNDSFGNFTTNEPVKVEAVLTRNSMKSSLGFKTVASTAPKYIPAIVYKSDEVELLPRAKKVHTSNAFSNISVGVVDDSSDTESDRGKAKTAVSVKVVSEKKLEKLHFTDVPSVVLKGNLAVTQVEVPTRSRPAVVPHLPEPLPAAALSEVTSKPVSISKATARKLPFKPVDNGVTRTHNTFSASIVAVVIVACGCALGFVTITATDVSVSSANLITSSLRFDLTALAILGW